MDSTNVLYRPFSVTTFLITLLLGKNIKGKVYNTKDR